MPAGDRVGVLLMTYGSPATLADVPDFLLSVRHGNPAPVALVEEFRRRYSVIGFSPLVRVTQAQGQALQEMLDSRSPGRHHVEVGMLHTAPTIESAVQRLAARGVDRVVAITLSPQWSPLIMGGYTRAVTQARRHLDDAVEVSVAGPWHDLEAFLGALTEKVVEARRGLAASDVSLVTLLTVHSLPKQVVDREPEYLEQLMSTVRAVVTRAALDEGEWRFAYQSAGHTPEEWLTPDLKDLLPGLRQEGFTDVLVVPVQFLADHLEILYDIDVAARDEAESAGLRFHRIALMNTSPAFIRALAEVVARELTGATANPRRA